MAERLRADRYRNSSNTYHNEHIHNPEPNEIIVAMPKDLSYDSEGVDNLIPVLGESVLKAIKTGEPVKNEKIFLRTNTSKI